MAEKGDYTISNIYQGGYSSFTPYNTEATAGSMGLTTDPRSANILQEVSSKLSTGVKHIEIEVVSPDMIDQIPKQQMEEVRRLKALTGIEVSMHGPVIDTTGISQQGFSELNRESSERKIIETINRSHELDPKGNILVNFHSSEGIPGTEYKQIPGEKEKGEAKRLIVVNRESGRLAPLEQEKMHYPGSEIPREDLTKKEIQEYKEGSIPREKIFKSVPLEKGEKITPEWRVKNLNATEWDNSISQLIFNKERADEILQQNEIQIADLLPALNSEKFHPNNLTPTQKQAYRHYQNAETYLQDTRQQVNALFHKAYKYGNKDQQKALEQFSKEFTKDLSKDSLDPNSQSEALHSLLIKMKDTRGMAPVMNVPVEQFAVEQASKTFGNAAFESWNKFKESAPIISIENPPAGFALSTGEDLKNLAEASRKQFVEKAVESGKLSKSDAEKQAEKLIGVTWDVGHINMIRKQGFEDKDIIKETEKIAPYLKHVHLSDNFGFEHTELPMGMGNVPTKEIMEKLGKKGFEAKKVIEAAHWWQHFKSPPVQESFEAMGSPIYSDGVGPYWNQALGFQQDYYSGYGSMLPSVHYNMQGSGFSMASLPTELGGQIPGAQGSRMSGRGME